MSNWIPGVAVFGLVCLMVIPAPGILGLIIGAACVVTIMVSALVILLDMMSTRMIAHWERMKARRTSAKRRAVHAGSGIARKA
ncbi:MAG TPA: hypothetical protein VF641_09045 [Methylobacterium sp.]